MKQFSRYWTQKINEWNPVISEGWKINEMNLTISQANSSEKVSRWWYRKKESRQSPAVSLSWGDEAGSLHYNSSSPETHSMREIVDKLIFIKIKNCSVKDNARRIKSYRLKIFARNTSDKEC